MDLKSIIHTIMESNSRGDDNLQESAASSEIEAAGTKIFTSILGGGVVGKVKHTSVRGMDFVEADVNFKKLFGAPADLLWKKMTVKAELFEKENMNGYMGKVDLRWEHTDGGRNGYTIGGGISDGKSAITWTDQSDAHSAMVRWGRGAK